MPTYKNMFSNYVDFESVKPRMRALSTMPLDTYSDREIAEASKHAADQAQEIADIPLAAQPGIFNTLKKRRVHALTSHPRPVISTTFPQLKLSP